MNTATLTAIIAALVPLIVAVTALITAVKAKNGAGPAGAAAGTKAVTDHLGNPGSEIRALVAKVARSAAADHVQTLVQDIGLPFMPRAQEHQPLPVVPEELPKPPMVVDPEAASTEQAKSFPMAPPLMPRLGEPINPNRPK